MNINQSLLSQVETECGRLQQARQAQFRGTARIRLSSLRADQARTTREQFLRPKNVRRLHRIFATEGCRRLAAENHIPALISREDLEAAIYRSSTTQSALLHSTDEEPPELQLPFEPLVYLHGRHRIQAAREFFAEGDAWWTVDLYLDNIDVKLRESLREEYSNAANFSDGEIFRHIRLHKRDGDILQERKWWARLTKDKSKDLKRILDVQSLREAFDRLLEVTGLWPAFHIGTMRRYLLLRCHEELANYLNLIYKVWSEIAGDDLTVMRLVDEITVKCLELRAPGNSDEDARTVSARVDDGSIFGAIINPSVRRSLLANILKQQQLIPSLHTFCEDTKYLEPCANAIKRLLGPGLKGTVRSTMRTLFGQSLRGYADDCFEHRYRQLWAFAHRHFPELVNVAPRKELDRDKPTIKEPNPITWYRFAQLALDLGFMSDPLLRLRSKKKLEDSLRDFMVPITEHILDRKLVGQLVRQLRRTIVAKRDAGPGNEKPLIVDDKIDVDLRHRCGRPYEASQDEARRSLYTQWIYDSYSANGRYVTHHYVHRAIFRAFFGASSTPEVGTAVPGPERGVDRQTDNDAQQQNSAQDFSSLIRDWDSRSTVDQSIRSASEALDDAMSIDESSDSHLSLSDVFEAAQQPRSATAPQEQSTNEGRGLSLIANWDSLNDSPSPFEPRLNLPDPVPMTIDRQMLEATDSSLPPGSVGSVVTAAGPSSDVLSSNFWQTKGVPLLLYPSGESVVTVAGSSNDVLSSNVWQINRLPNNVSLSTLLPETPFAVAEGPEKGMKQAQCGKKTHVELEQVGVQLAIPQVEPTLHNYQQRLAESSIAKELSTNVNRSTLLQKTSFAVAKRPKKRKIKQAKSEKKTHVEPEQAGVQLALSQAEPTLHSCQQRLADSPIVKLSPVAKAPDPQPHVKGIIRRREAEIIERRKFRNISDKTISVPLMELSPYVDQEILGDNSGPEAIDQASEASGAAHPVSPAAPRPSRPNSRTRPTKSWGGGETCPPPDLSTRPNDTQVLERHSKAVETAAAAEEEEEEVEL